MPCSSYEIAMLCLVLAKHPQYGCYLFPRTAAAVNRLKQLKAGKVNHVSFP